MSTKQKITLVVFGALMALLMTVGRANAQLVCGQHADLLNQLDQKHSEYVRAIGLTRTGSLMELLESDGGTTWTILVTLPSGNTCAVFVGENLRIREPRVTNRRAGWQPSGR